MLDVRYSIGYDLIYLKLRLVDFMPLIFDLQNSSSLRMIRRIYFDFVVVYDSYSDRSIAEHFESELGHPCRAHLRHVARKLVSYRVIVISYNYQCSLSSHSVLAASSVYYGFPEGFLDHF